MFSFQALVLKGNHHHFGNENFNKTKNSQKNINNGNMSFSIQEKKFSFSVFMFISVHQFKLIHKSTNDVFSGFFVSNILYMFSW